MNLKRIRTQGWDFTIAVGYTAVGLLVAIGLLVLLSGRLGIGPKLAALLPESVHEFFTSPGPERQGASRVEETRDALLQRLKELRAQSPEIRKSLARTFAVGASKDEVLLAQGAPDAATPSVWRYGKSEVYFLNDRVASWSNSVENPLKVR